jgi:hypothetical protein
LDGSSLPAAVFRGADAAARGASHVTVRLKPDPTWV